MSNTIVIFGGAGYIGTHLAQYALKTGLADKVVLADIQPSRIAGQPGIEYHKVDVREPIPTSIVSESPSWIFNFAAIHREPGHKPYEYFETNLRGANTVCDFATQVGCKNIFFTSSISVYGPTSGPTDESAPICPISPYGGSKFPAELIHEKWMSMAPDRRLIVIRPGVVYGPEDPGNIGRMVKAIQKGYFAFPGSMDVYKSYAYIYGLLDSIRFTIDSGERFVTYNYVETPTETLGAIANAVKKFVGSKAPILSLPTSILLPAARMVQAVAGNKNPVHPVRVRKASMSTHIIPAKLKSMGFPFKYTFASSLEHWRTIAPHDFPESAQ